VGDGLEYDQVRDASRKNNHGIRIGAVND